MFMGQVMEVSGGFFFCGGGTNKTFSPTFNHKKNMLVQKGRGSQESLSRRINLPETLTINKRTKHKIQSEN